MTEQIPLANTTCNVPAPSIDATAAAASAKDNNPYTNAPSPQQQQQQHEVQMPTPAEVPATAPSSHGNGHHLDNGTAADAGDVAENLANMTAPTESCPVEEYPDVKCFEDYNFDENILRGVYACGFENPSVVQSKAIRPHISKRDVIVQAQSGTGKTAAFLLGALSSIDVSTPKPQVIVLCHTRELVKQTATQLTNLAKFTSIRHHKMFGGLKDRESEPDHIALARGPHIVVTTIGKCKQALERRNLDTQFVRSIIIDEADKMMEDTSGMQIFDICSEMKNKTQIQMCLYSATMPAHIVQQFETFMRPGYYKLLLNPEKVSLDGIKHYVQRCADDDAKINTIRCILDDIEVQTTVVFVNKKIEVDRYYQYLTSNGYPCAAIHGDMVQEDRTAALGGFRQGKFRILISTDLVGRGIDVQQISLVINSPPPISREDYMHRAGRSGRFGRKGITINLCTENEEAMLYTFSEFYKFPLKVLPSDLSTL